MVKVSCSRPGVVLHGVGLTLRKGRSAAGPVRQENVLLAKTGDKAVGRSKCNGTGWVPGCLLGKCFRH